VSGVKLTHLSKEDDARRLEEGGAWPEAPFGRRLRAEFTALGRTWRMDLSLHEALYDEGAVTRWADEEGNEVVEPLRAVAYTGSLADGGWFRATVHDHDVLHCVWVEGGEMHMLVPLTYYEVRCACEGCAPGPAPPCGGPVRACTPSRHPHDPPPTPALPGADAIHPLHHTSSSYTCTSLSLGSATSTHPPLPSLLTHMLPPLTRPTTALSP
jgi:hypothetical protein